MKTIIIILAVKEKTKFLFHKNPQGEYDLPKADASGRTQAEALKVFTEQTGLTTTENKLIDIMSSYLNDIKTVVYKCDDFKGELANPAEFEWIELADLDKRGVSKDIKQIIDKYLGDWRDLS